LGSKRKRLFFALWPDPEVRSRLAALQSALPQQQGNWVYPEDLHITLQFLGPVDPAQQACIAEAAGAVHAEPFDLEIDRLDFWSKPRIVWAGVEGVPPQLKQLVEDLGQNLEQCGFQPEKRAYRPHVTLLRKTTPIENHPLEKPIPWHVDHFVLVESRPGGDPPWYRPLEGWSLGEGGR